MKNAPPSLRYGPAGDSSCAWRCSGGIGTGNISFKSSNACGASNREHAKRFLVSELRNIISQHIFSETTLHLRIRFEGDPLTPQQQQLEIARIMREHQERQTREKAHRDEAARVERERLEKIPARPPAYWYDGREGMRHEH